VKALAGWASALRIARREARRARGRSVLVLVMITLPVLGVACADVLVHTYTVSGTEALDRRVGAADALVSFHQNITRAAQGADPDRAVAEGGTGGRQPDTGLDAVAAALHRPVRGIERHEGSVRVATEKGRYDVQATELDLRDPLSHGIFELLQGRLPRTRDEVVVNSALADRGPGIGSELDVVDGPTRHVVGVVRSTTSKEPGRVVGLPGSLGVQENPHEVDWLVDAHGPVSWSDVRALNRIGAVVVSPYVLRHPPSRAQLPPNVRDSVGGTDSAVVTVAVLVVVMALIEVVLLAGPAFAVGARRLQLSLALVASSGGTPRQLRRIVLATAVLLGGFAAVVGLVLGIGLAAALLPLVQRMSTQYAGPFDLRWQELAGIAGFGFASAVLAAYVPAWLASRQDPVAVLAGRRGDPRPRARSPLAGLALLGLGVAGAVVGARRSSGGENFIAGSAILAVLGMVLLIPVVLAALGRVAQRWPLFLRYAVRDAARHRTRTVPAVAAVAATVAGVVALGIGQSSDEAQNRGTYSPSLAMGSAVLTGVTTPRQWAELSEAARRELPSVRPLWVRGIDESLSRDTFVSLSVSVARQPVSGSYTAPYGSDFLVGSRLPRVGLGIPDEARAAADRTLARGGVVVLTDRAMHGRHARIHLEVDKVSGAVKRSAGVTALATVARSTHGVPRAQAVVAPSVARRLGAPMSTTALWLPGPVTVADAQDLSEEAVAVDGGFYVERGYQSNDESRIVQLVLGVLGAVLMLGGTLTATFLALSDARSDLATLSAVGASPRMRRRVAAAYAGVTGLVGALLGVLVGFVPGIAVSFPLTSSASAAPVPGAASHYLDIPWLLIGSLVVLLPLLTASVVGLTSRAGLPLVARVD
jgi:putative ABC transport system permease protein